MYNDKCGLSQYFIRMRFASIKTFLVFVAVTSCAPRQDPLGVKIPGVVGVFTFDNRNGTDENFHIQSVYYEAENSKQLIFQGEGGDRINLWKLGANDIALSFCRGNIIVQERTFREWPTPEATRLLTLRVLHDPRLRVNGVRICK